MYNIGIKRMIERQQELAKLQNKKEQEDVERLFDVNERLIVLVTGKVQGVSFRRYVLEEAKKHGLVGIAKNLGENLEVIAEGKREQLEHLLEHIKKGPPEAKISDIEVKWQKASGEFNDFTTT